MKYYIGIDLGGTNVRVAKVSENAEIIQMIKEATEIDLGVKHVMNKIIKMIESIDDFTKCHGIGIGVPGPVDTKEGKMLMASNLPGFENYPIAKELQDHFNIPTFIDNDANVAGLGEAVKGAGEGKETCYYVTISTGIGGALVHDGRVISGKHGHAGEVGNMIIDRHREKSFNHLNTGAIENEASGTAITRKGKALFGDEIKHAGHVFDLARKGNKKALKLVDEMAYDLAVMFSLIAHVVDPDVFIIGGGVMTKAKDVFFNKMVAYFKSMIHKGMQGIEFKEAILEEPGIVGAAMLPLSHI